EEQTEAYPHSAGDRGVRGQSMNEPQHGREEAQALREWASWTSHGEDDDEPDPHEEQAHADSRDGLPHVSHGSSPVRLVVAAAFRRSRDRVATAANPLYASDFHEEPRRRGNAPLGRVSPNSFRTLRARSPCLRTVGEVSCSGPHTAAPDLRVRP